MVIVQAVLLGMLVAPAQLSQRQLQVDNGVDQALLCAVVQIASDAAAGFVCRGDESCP